MIDKSHIRKFNACQRYVPTEEQLQTVRTNIRTYLPLATYLVEKYSITDTETLKATIIDFVYTIFDSCASTSYVDSKLYELQAIESILKNPSFISEEYEEASKTPNTHTVYTANLIRSKKLALVNAVDEVNISENFAKEKRYYQNFKPKRTC